jgi:hypothetical protein
MASAIPYIYETLQTLFVAAVRIEHHEPDVILFLVIFGRQQFPFIPVRDYRDGSWLGDTLCRSGSIKGSNPEIMR